MRVFPMSVLLGLMALGGCSNDLEGNEGQPGDKDGDGFTTEDDCDDEDPNTYPGAPEICDGKDNDCDGEIPEWEYDLDGNGLRECEEICSDAPGEGSISTISDCEYTPSPSGTAFSARIEWHAGNAMVDPASGATLPAFDFAEYPDAVSTFQSPAVGNATSDNTPDIAIIMGDELGGANYSVIRLFSGDGSRLHATGGWQSFTNANGSMTYAPYLFAGLAMADTDGDGRTEIATVVISDETGECYPALYEVVESGGDVEIVLDAVYEGGDYYCASHAPALADIDGDGWTDVIYGKNVLEGDDLSEKFSGNGGRGWYGDEIYSGGYWNSGYHSFAYDLDGDGSDMEIVAGRTVYDNTGEVYCELGRYSGSTWIPATDGYPAVADLLRFSGDSTGEPEIVITGNEYVSVYHGTTDYDPYGYDRCVEIDQLPNKPEDDPDVASGLPSHPDCNSARRAFGGQPTIADFNGDGSNEIAVAGSCWYSVYSFDSSGDLYRYALYPTRDWSSASTGSTLFDFNGDGANEIVFSDEDALFVWGIDTSPGLDPWERLVVYLEDDNHKSWTIHEYPLVADVDGDGKAEIVVLNSGRPGHADYYGLYVLGAADDDWVSARPVWNQHAYYVTNVEDDGEVGYASPNYGPYSSPDYNSFRLQAPGAFGALAAPNLVAETDICQEGCGPVTVHVQVGNEGRYISADAGIQVALYGVSGSSRTLLDVAEVPTSIEPGVLTEAMTFEVDGWDVFDYLVAHVDDPDVSGTSWDWGIAKECDEDDNVVEISLDGVCP